MLENNIWEKGKIHFKKQDYPYSYFASCLQTVLVNWGIITNDIITNNPRPIEEEFNLFFDSKLDNEAPSIEKITEYLNKKNYLTVTDYSGDIVIDKDLCNAIKACMENSQNSALIGAVKDAGGHALCLMRRKGQYYGFNPRCTINEVMSYSANPLELVQSTDRTSFALGIPNIGCVNAFYVITQKNK